MPLEFDSFTPSDESALTVKDRIVAYLQQRGFQRVQSGDELHFRRGSLLGTIFGLSPRTWNAEVLVRQGGEEEPGWHVRFTIDTTGQIVSGPEREYWEREQQAVCEVIKGNEPPSMEGAESAVRRMLWTLIGLGSAGALLGTFAGSGCGLFLKALGWGMPLAGTTMVGGVFGALAGMAFAMTRIRR